MLIPFSMKRTLLADLATFFFIILFAYSGAAKLTEINTFRQQLASSPFMGSIAGFVTWGLPIGELLLAIALFLPKFRLRALYVTLVLMTIFTGYVITILLIDDQLTCSCGGIIEDLTPKQHILFNSACVILSLLAILVFRRQHPTLLFRWLTGSSTLALLAIIGWSLCSAFTAPLVVKTGLEGRILPSFDLQLTDSVTYLNTQGIPTGKAFIVIGFATWCAHCQALTYDIAQHIGEFKDTRIYYVTHDGYTGMKAFYDFYKLGKCPGIIMGRDTANFFFPYFNAKQTPLIAIFDAKKRLKKVVGTNNAIQLAQIVDN